MSSNAVKAGDAYYDWVMRLAPRLHTFATFTFARPQSYHTAFNIGVRLWRLTNEKALGRGFRSNKGFLTTVFSVEASHARPHIHFLQEAHPTLTPEVYAKLWREAYGRWYSKNAIKVERIRSKKAVARYLCKEIDWDKPLFVSPARA